jgi:molecular chaperone IbpA
MSTFSMVPLYRSSIGFDRLNDLFESMMSTDTASYPPYNVVKKGDDEYRIEVVAAGMSDKDLDIQVEKDVLTIASSRRESQETVQYLHRGIAQRAFKLSFRLAEYIEVQHAALENGMLHVDLVRRVPDAAKPRRIAVNGSNVTSISKAA